MADPLSLLERRILGVLVEKALTSASPEPLTLNAIVTGSNQKSNRDPVMELEEPEVDSTLETLKRKGLVFHVTGSRVDRWRHNLYDAWTLTKPALALIGELLLRGAQTAAEARTRASRMVPIDNSEMTDLLKDLVDRGYVVWLDPEGRRGAQLTHGFYSPDELNRVQNNRVHAPSHEPISAVPTVSTPSTPAPDYKAEFEKLWVEVNDLREQVKALQVALGIEPSKPA
jgi:uncharacterized protein YceH (UPF0502 family)